MKNILFLVGSLRSESLNKKVAEKAATLLPEGYEASTFDISGIPLYNADLDGENAPSDVLALREAIIAADGVFWVTPEYNYSIPGVVKNIIDWASRPMLPRHSMIGKPMNAVVATVSPTNGIRALTELKRLWSAVGGAPVTTFDFVVQQANTKFVEQDGKEDLEPFATAGLQSAIDNLVRAIEHNIGASVRANWDATWGNK